MTFKTWVIILPTNNISEPGVLVQVTGAPLASATRYNLQKLRCAICEIIYTAPLPTGVSGQKYDANVVEV